MVLAAAGLSSLESDDYCAGTGTSYTFFPPGWHCEPWSEEPEAAGMTQNTDSGSWLWFLTILAAGLLLVFRRRTKTAVAVAIVLGTIGASALYVGFLGAFSLGWFLGTFLALLVTRNVVAAATAALAGMAAGFVYLFGGSGAIVIVLLLLILIPQHAEGLVPDARSH